MKNNGPGGSTRLNNDLSIRKLPLSPVWKTGEESNKQVQKKN